MTVCVKVHRSHSTYVEVTDSLQKGSVLSFPLVDSKDETQVVGLGDNGLYPSHRLSNKQIV